MAVCRKCNAKLIMGENWYESSAKKCDYICIGCSKTYRQQHRQKYPKETTAYNQRYKQEHCEETAAYNRQYKKDHREEITAYMKQYRREHHKEIIAWLGRYQRKQYRTNVQFRLALILRTRLNLALGNNQKAGSAVSDLGCSISEVKDYLESLFQEGMSWDNHGEWHIDHIIPLSSFELSNREQFLEACHFTNLQPLWAEDHHKKHGNSRGEKGESHA